MKKNHIHLTYTLTFESAFHIGTGMSRGLIDRGVARDAGGVLYIPGSTIKGILREKCEQLAAFPLFGAQQTPVIASPHLEHLRVFAATPTLVEAIFGSRYREGTVFFDQAALTDEDKAFNKEFHVEIRTRTCISRLRNTVQEQALFRSEYGLADLAFTGAIYGIVEGPEISENICSPVVLLAAGLRMFDRIGANKSVGMGQFTFRVTNEKIRIENKDKTLDELIELL